MHIFYCMFKVCKKTNIALNIWHCLRFRRHFFLSIPNYMVSGFLRKIFGLEGVIEKCVGCFLVYLFFKKKKNLKTGIWVIIKKKRIVTSFLCVFMVKKGICKKGVLGSCRTHYWVDIGVIQKTNKNFLSKNIFALHMCPMFLAILFS